MQVRFVDVQIKIDGADVSRDLSPYLRGLTYEDVETGETDSVTLELMDREKLFIDDWLPDKGSTLEVVLTKKNWSQTDETFPLGTFEIDEIEFSTPPSVMKIKANSCPQNSALRQVNQSRSWENVLLSKICADISEEAGVELFYQTDFDPEIKRAEQGERSGLAFLENLCKKYGLIVKFADNQIIVVEESKLENAESVATFTPEKIKKISFKSTLTEIYKACEVNYNHGEHSELYQARVEDSSKTDGKVLKINRRVNSQAEAEHLAAEELRDKNKSENKMTLAAVGDFNLSAGSVIAIEGFGKFSGRYLIEKATHRIGNGYETSIEAHRCLEY